METNFSTQIHKILKYSREEALRLRNDFISTEHILLGLLKDGKNNIVQQILTKLDCDIKKLRKKLEESINPLPFTVLLKDVPLTKRAENVLKRAWVEANRNQSLSINIEHLFLALLQEKEGLAAKVLNSFNINYDKVKRELDILFGESELEKQTLGTSIIKQFGEDLNESAKNNILDPVIERDKEIVRIIRILTCKKKNNPILVGEPGVGKTAIVEGLANYIVQRKVPYNLIDTRIFRLDLTSLMAGTSMRGQLEKRLQFIFKIILKFKNIILFIDEIHNIIGTGGNNSPLDISNMLKPLLADGNMKCIGTTTLTDYQKYFEKDRALERRFQKVLILPPNIDQTYNILKGLKNKYECYHHVYYTNSALKAAVKLSQRYLTDRFLPDKAIDLLDEAGAQVHLENSEVNPMTYKDLNNDPSVNKFFEKFYIQERTVHSLTSGNHNTTFLKVTENDIARTLHKITRIPMVKLKQPEATKYLSLENNLNKVIVGQKEANRVLSNALKRARVGLKDHYKPIGSFIFVGPSGVGKTKLAQELANILFVSKNAFYQLDMSEYMERFSVSRLIGAPPGYVGYDKGGELTEKVRRRPFSVILFENIDKAHPEITNILLQILSEGTLTDSLGRKVDFRNTIIILTFNNNSNIDREIGFISSNNSMLYDIKKFFAPELIDRIDEIVEFKNLSAEALLKIIKMELDELRKRLSEIDITISISPQVQKYLLKCSMNGVTGGRHIKRILRNAIEDTIAEKIIKRNVKSGDHIFIKKAENGLKFMIKR